MKKLLLAIIMLLAMASHCFADTSFSAIKIPEGTVPTPNQKLQNNAKAIAQLQQELEAFQDSVQAVQELLKKWEAIKITMAETQETINAKMAAKTRQGGSVDRSEGLAVLKAVTLYGKFEDRYNAQGRIYVAFMSEKNRTNMGRIADTKQPADLPIVAYYAKKFAQHQKAFEESIKLLSQAAQDVQQIADSM